MEKERRQQEGRGRCGFTKEARGGRQAARKVQEELGGIRRRAKKSRARRRQDGKGIQPPAGLCFLRAAGRAASLFTALAVARERNLSLVVNLVAASVYVMCYSRDSGMSRLAMGADEGASMDLSGEEGFTAMMWASLKGH